ncbi:MAG: tetrahydrofolate dehydrogenase/cyclohydrolase catalytic domain-containing protein [Prolixibacteraceae bacterium]|jgi:methylenetetrahydrofolate dehydrogenase (NADP+)/methenyltetrahydrofolate cyclohydrolase|nr:bifunctional 5,10-methylene-tetrahydrofolate dehydrogenase/5,10-methylene-tetrahydrofolate cyclohydrolase [Prolixibacteraceae bacterium]MDI9565044.1 tetrahydrofolate dehydrogenase/cyclohydrolase catalytic domain-containing protein [Bacteroidota bacterium]NLT00487.1 bifunctional 5,10-methylene-tetrahydrofolate dehydrogenase/5,10-methylene-tetrahydrofolate cyclohydrolase [Bacteroidales bacterium]OQB81003.1 MAG: Bifunctional protein FolD protein [Bacteroidetes bacterium ADurb.Bin123]HNZ68884.1 
MKIIDGKKIAADIKAEIAAEVGKIKTAGRRPPHLAAILVGHDGGSESYVAHKIRDCEEVGFTSTLIRFEEDVREEVLLEAVDRLNRDREIDGFIVQLPLPPHIDEQKVIEAIDPARDVDGFHPVNVGRMVLGIPSFVSATPFGIVEMLTRSGIETSGKNCVIIGRSNIVGRPLSILMSQKKINATVTVAHSRTQNLEKLCAGADILVAAMGMPGFVTESMVKEGAVVIDVGTTRVPDPATKSGFRLKGDVNFEEVAPKCSFITPVPGGVGPMTRVSLLLNTLKAASK